MTARRDGLSKRPVKSQINFCNTLKNQPTHPSYIKQISAFIRAASVGAPIGNMTARHDGVMTRQARAVRHDGPSY